MKDLNIQLLTSPRTGSSFLCEILNNYPGLELNLSEKYNETNNSYLEMIKHQDSKDIPYIKNTKVFGHLMDNYGFDLREIAKQHKNTYFIHLIRRDIIAQIVSHYICSNSGLWSATTIHSKRSQSYINSRILHNLHTLDNMVDYILYQRSVFPDYLVKYKIDHHTIYYEDILDDPEYRISELFKYLGLEKKYIKYCLDNVNRIILRDIKPDFYKPLTSIVKRIYGDKINKHLLRFSI